MAWQPPITDRTEMDVIARNEKGNYNASDLNRVGECVQILADVLNMYGYFATVDVKTDWEMSDIPTATDMETHLENIDNLINVSYTLARTPPLPDNNNYEYGDYYHTYDKGAPMPFWDEGMEDNIPLTATGSGPKDWFHNNDFSGIADLNGNVNEWVGGVRLNNGEIQIIANNDAAQAIDQSASSTLWKAIAQNGSLVAPGTAGTLKYASGSIIGADGSPFKSLTAAGGVTIPVLAKALALFPADESSTYRDDYIYAGTSGERLCFRGGDCADNDYSGVFFCDLFNARSYSFINLGFRSAFVEL